MPNLSLSKEKIKVVLLEGVHERAVRNFQRDGYTNIVHLRGTPDRDELKALLADARIVGIRSRTQLDRELLAGADKLIAIGTFCIGTNQIDLEYARQKGIPVFNAPFSNTRSVAELALAELIFLMRGIPEKNAAAHRGQWIKSAENAYEIRGKKLGIVGFGHIGSQLGILAEALGMQVLYYDIENKLPLGNARAVDSLEELLEKSDAISLHVPATPQTVNLIGREQIARMRPGSYLLNAARGNVVDIKALTEALETGHIRGAAIDVFPTEPASNAEEFLSPLRRFDQVILTPHIGGSTQEAQVNIADEVSNKLIKYSNNGTTSAAVNFPKVALPELHPNQHRIMHIHRNIPGMMEQINRVFSARGMNVAAMYLQTLDDTGYVIMDVDASSADADALKQDLRAINGTIRVRVLH
jgi:D-3-phosphoglycerate dehydrogenase